MTDQKLRNVIAVVFLVSLTFQIHSLLSTSFSSVHAMSRFIHLNGFTSAGWNESIPGPTITVVQGDSISLTISSRDGAPHIFAIDVDGSGTPPSSVCPPLPDKCSQLVPPDTTYTFDVDFSAGTYTYYCTFHPGPMVGTWVVQGFTMNATPPSLRIIRGSSDLSTITVTSVKDFVGDVALSVNILPSGPTPTLNATSIAVSPTSPGTSTLTVSTTDTTATGSYVVTVTGTNGSSLSTLDVAIAIVARDFTMSADPSALVIPLGSSKSSTITLGSLDQFSGSIDLSMSSLPSVVTVMFSPNPVALLAGGTATSTMDVTASLSATPGTYTVDVVGTSGSLQHTTTVTLVVGRDFGISLDPAMISILPGQYGTSTMTVTSFNNFSGTVDLSVNGAPTGLVLSISPVSVTVLPDGTVAAVLNATALATTQAGNYTVTVIGSSGSMLHSASVTVAVRDFSIASSVSSLTLSQGSSGTVTISLSSINGFTGSVGLATTAPNSLSIRLNTTSVSLGPSGGRSATLIANTGSSSAGSYTITVTGTSGSVAHSISLAVMVSSVTDGGPASPILLAGATIAVMAFALVAIYFLRRGKKENLGTTTF